MTWSEVINQNRAKEVLKRGIEQDRVAHAYLFYGPNGVGKRAVALAFAQTLQCLNELERPCNACNACRKVSRMLHPDVHVLFPYPNDADPEDIGERIRQLGENPYVPVDYIRRPSLSDPHKVSNKQSMYTVARINSELRRAMSFKPVEGRYKISILSDVETMRQEAANAFLKLLEEPGPATIFVLITSRPDKVLPTILSRCQQLRFDPLSNKDIEQALISRLDLEPAKASTLSRMANGSYTRALDLAENEELLESRQLILEYIRYSYTQNTDKLSDVIEQLNALGRERLKGALLLMLSWIRDLMLYKTVGNDSLMINLDQKESIERFCRNVPDAHIDAMARMVEEAVELVGRNVQIYLVLVTLSNKLYFAMKGNQEGRLYVPLHETVVTV